MRINWNGYEDIPKSFWEQLHMFFFGLDANQLSSFLQRIRIHRLCLAYEFLRFTDSRLSFKSQILSRSLSECNLNVIWKIKMEYKNYAK